MLKINFECFKYKRWPKVKIFVDGDLLEEVHFSQQYEDVQMPLSVLEGEHLLEIEHFDKNNNDTQYVNGEILQDTKFEIKNINVEYGGSKKQCVLNKISIYTQQCNFRG